MFQVRSTHLKSFWFVDPSDTHVRFGQVTPLQFFGFVQFFCFLFATLNSTFTLFLRRTRFLKTKRESE